jgi:hypothetical protein
VGCGKGNIPRIAVQIPVAIASWGEWRLIAEVATAVTQD